MRERTLFERLLAGAGGDARRSDLRVSELTQSVLANLGYLLNVHRGSSLARPDYGMPDFNDLVFDFPNTVPRLVRILEEQIIAFEPRLKNCRVRFVDEHDDPLTLNFVITARLNDDRGAKISFETIIGEDGCYRLRA